MKENQNVDAFQNVKDQIGYCGIWCGSCVVGNGTLRELTKRYKELINAYGLKGWAPKDFDFDQFYKGLESIQSMPLCAGCLKGGGRDDCEIRTCATNKGLEDCTSCQQFSQCKIELLEHMRSGARKAGLSVKNQDDDGKETVERWMSELKAKWPCCILFINDKP
jgi:hypothetical protein